MGILIFIFSVALVSIIPNTVLGAVNKVPLPAINLTEWWGPGNVTIVNTTIANFTIQLNDTVRTLQQVTSVTYYKFGIQVVQRSRLAIEYFYELLKQGTKMISDLKSRLESRRTFKPPLEGVAFNYGFNSTTLQTWIQYLLDDYDFESRETYLNQYSHYKTYIQGLNIHYMRVTSNSSYTVVPLLLLHGWPGSFREYYDTIPYLISLGEDRSIAFDIIVPSLPGFAFSDGAVRPGLGVDKVAIVLRNLMQRIGYKKFCVHGKELGSMVAANMATFFPTEVIGYHTTFAFFHTPDILFRLMLGVNHTDEIANATAVNRLYPLSDAIFNLTTATGYLHHLATKPDTVGIVTSNSPAGLIAYMFEKFSVGVRKRFIDYPDGGLTEILSPEQMFDNFIIYWSTNCMTTAGRLYAETYNKRYFGLRLNEIRSPVPVWALQTPDEYIYLPGWMIKLKFPNFLNETLPSKGGHFYPWEEPERFAVNVVKAVVAFRSWQTMNSTSYSECTSYISD